MCLELRLSTASKRCEQTTSPLNFAIVRLPEKDVLFCAENASDDHRSRPTANCKINKNPRRWPCLRTSTLFMELAPCPELGPCDHNRHHSIRHCHFTSLLPMLVQQVLAKRSSSSPPLSASTIHVFGICRATVQQYRWFRP